MRDTRRARRFEPEYPKLSDDSGNAPALILDIEVFGGHTRKAATGRHDGRHHVRPSLEPHRQTFEAIHIQRGRDQPIFHNQPHRGNGQQFVRAALFKRVPGCGWERRFVRHIAHGPNLIQRFTRHIENRIRQILRRFTYAREQAVLGEQAAPRRLKARALPAIIILLQTHA